MSAQSIMVMGTASGVGKSVIATALCRAFARRGIRVAPFKSQNMSNNAAVCADGAEIGRAQATQAFACGLEPQAEMNPVLLKPESGGKCQVVIGGRVQFRMGFADHQHYRDAAWPEIVRSYRSLANRFELIVIEGAGAAAEVNLRDRDLANWPIAELADAPVMLAGDIDRGGVFASLIGTIDLLTPRERSRVKGLLINKFRGDRTLFASGIRFLEERAGIPVIGIVPHADRLGIPDEDAAALSSRVAPRIGADVKIGVVHLPAISNFTDFEALENEPDVAVHYLTDPTCASELDVIIIPGSKSTAQDLRWLRAAGWEDHLARHYRRGGFIVGICAGYQMLGRRIVDRDGIESDRAETIGLGWLDVETAFADGKITDRVSAIHLPTGLGITGYEIHAGHTRGFTNVNAPFRIVYRASRVVDELAGAASGDGRVFGTSIHGLFDAPAYRRSFIDTVRASRGLAPWQDAEANPAQPESPFDRAADLLEANIDLARVAAIAGIRWRI